MLLVVAKEDWDQENWLKRTGKVSSAKLAKLPRYLREENHLSDNDWEVLRHLERILTIFETVAKTLEGDGKVRNPRGWSGSYGNVWDVFLGFELLLSKLEEFKLLAEGFPDSEHFRIGVNLEWEKLYTIYYQRLDETPIYYTALALHPAYRWDWCEEIWQLKPEWIARAKALVHEVWVADYAHLDIRATSRGSSKSDDEPVAKRPRFFNPFEDTDRATKVPRTRAVIGDEYIAWQLDRDASDSEVRDPLAYWIARQERYPRLSTMAMDFLIILPMSAECERVCSAAGKMVGPLRASLEAQTIGICQVLRSWYRARILQGKDDDILPLALQNRGGDYKASELDWLGSDVEAYSKASSLRDAESSSDSDFE